jgi:uncharacterized protein (TIGR04141 family)
LDEHEQFWGRVRVLQLSYAVDPDSDAPRIPKNLVKCLHGQVDLDGTTYFLLDKTWYESRGTFLENLKRDFMDEVFTADEPIYITDDIGFTPWSPGEDEGAYNERQAGEDNFYYGDKIFSLTDGGKVELFDLLKVDRANDTLYVIHVKDGFDGKMRDACSQIATSADVISRDVKTGKAALRKYYAKWKSHPNNLELVAEDDFLAWFDLKNIVYVVLASTSTAFGRRVFERNRLKSHIARREIIVTRNEFRGYGRVFRLAHTRRG